MLEKRIYKFMNCGQGDHFNVEFTVKQQNYGSFDTFAYLFSASKSNECSASTSDLKY